MTFFSASLVAAIVCGLLVLDNLQAFQFMFARPFFAGTLAGIICGCPVEGAALGIAFELVYSAELPLGDIVPPSGLAGAVSAALAVKAGMFVPVAFFYGMVFDLAYSVADRRLRKFRSGWNIRVSEEINSGRLNLNAWIARSMAADFLAMFILILAAGLIASVICAYISISGIFNASAEIAFSLIPIIGLSMLYFRFKNNLKLYNLSEMGGKTEKIPEIQQKNSDFPVFNTYLRLFLVQSVWNYERMQNFGFLYALMPFLRQNYRKKKDFDEAVSRNFAKLNTNPMMGGILAGAIASMEKDYSEGRLPLKRMIEIRNSLATSAAAKGDGIFWIRLRSVSLQAGLMAAILFGFNSWIFNTGIDSADTSVYAIIAAALVSVLLFAIPACVMRWKALKAGLAGSEENLFGLSFLDTERIKLKLDFAGFVFSIALIINVFILFFARTRQADFTTSQTVLRFSLLLAMIAFGKYAARGLSLRKTALVLLGAALLFSALGLPIYFF